MTIPAFPGKIDEIAWVVDDLEAAMETWLKRGIGPFFVMSIDLPEVRYRDGRVPLSLRVGIARAGDVHIELVQQISNGPSAFRDCAPPVRGGIHHIRRQACAAGEASDYDAVLEEFAAEGVEMVMEMDFGGQRNGFVDMRARLGCLFEIYDPSPAIDSLKRLTAQAAGAWDGSAPTRQLDLTDLTH